MSRHRLRYPDAAEPLTPYELMVRKRIAALATDGALPITALTFRDSREAKRWNRRLHRAIIADARARGLSRRRVASAAGSLLLTVAAGSGAGVALAMFISGARGGNPELAPGLFIGSLVFGLLALTARGPQGERDTPLGRQAAARWLGVRDWLRNHPEFGDLPPAAVSVWGRYLPYGAALGVTPAANAVLDLGMGSRRLIWSSYGGRWRQVRVRYPRFWPRYGDPVSMLLLRSFLALVVGFVLFVEFGLAQALPGTSRNLSGIIGRRLCCRGGRGVADRLGRLCAGAYLRGPGDHPHHQRPWSRRVVDLRLVSAPP